jgi:hypothetical protein
MWIDGYSTLLIGLQMILLKCLCCTLFKGVIFITYVLSFYFKYAWIFIGLSSFLKDIEFDDCSGNSIQFLSIYFISFVYTLVCLVLGIITHHD